MNIVLIGMKHCGKTTQAKALASAYSRCFTDSDEWIERRHKECTGESLSCREIFQQFGEEYFRTLEAESIHGFLTRRTRNFVIALGGGTPGNAKAGELLRELGHILFLDVAPEIIYPRITANGLPPFLDADRPWESFLKIYDARRESYLKYADQTEIVTEELTPEALTARLITKLQQRGIR